MYCVIVPPSYQYPCDKHLHASDATALRGFQWPQVVTDHLKHVMPPPPTFLLQGCQQQREELLLRVDECSAAIDGITRNRGYGQSAAVAAPGSGGSQRHQQEH